MKKLCNLFERETPVKYVVLEEDAPLLRPYTHIPPQNIIETISFTDKLRENRQRELKKHSDQFEVIEKSILDGDVSTIMIMLETESFLNNHILLKLKPKADSTLKLLRKIHEKNMYFLSKCDVGDTLFIKKWNDFVDEVFDKLVTALSEKTSLEIRKEKTIDKEGICLELLEDGNYGIRFWW